MWKEKFIQNFVGKPYGKGHVGDQCVEVRVTSKWVSKK
jgi:hypothetical protein